MDECINSLINQTLKDIEIILLNDGSTDNTLAILKKYEKLDSRIKVYEHKNMGLGPTRNRGIKIANGEFLAFVDSDDFVSNTMFESLYNCAIAENADIAIGEVGIFSDREIERVKIRKSLTNLKTIELATYNKKEFFKQFYFNRLYSHNACDKIYRRSLVLEFNLSFGDNKIIFAEDNWFQLQVFMTNTRICFVDKLCYYYRQQNNSIMHKPKSNLVFRHGNMIADYEKLIRQNGNNIIDKKACMLVAFDVLIMEIFNQKNVGGTCEDYKNALVSLKHHKILRENISNIVRMKAYELEPNMRKKLALVTISIMFNFKMYKTAYNMLWRIYNR
ncbi:TPA: glycosyltransferase family 2 protein [Enterococcus faecium]|nr:glycosyltransferase family 2 protein [Enterococcus faecium]